MVGSMLKESISVASIWYTLSKVLHAVLVSDEDEELSSHKTLSRIMGGRTSMRYKETVSPETTRPETRPKMNIAIVKRLSKTAPRIVNVYALPLICVLYMYRYIIYKNNIVHRIHQHSIIGKVR
jgi:hypothetical protein